MTTRATISSSSHGSIGRYAIRLGLSLLLAVGPLAAVMAGFVPREVRLPAIVVLCAGHLLMQLVWFWHPGTRKDHRENTANFVGIGLVMAAMLADLL
ncbi:cytochrome o ubiquinol oxidase subunit IV [Massilia sp. METH4]|uniref:cytochrome o ubiquinol oxidase subunit IV n=1 Tax=Massilia sp. METH4 TaxID=3123041 RepID=UPI0030CD5D26